MGNVTTWESCWDWSIGGEPIGWRDACCELNAHSELRDFCWSSAPHSRNTCCNDKFKPPFPPSPSADSQIDRLQASLGFSHEEFALFLEGLPEPSFTVTGR